MEARRSWRRSSSRAIGTEEDDDDDSSRSDWALVIGSLGPRQRSPPLGVDFSALIGRVPGGVVKSIQDQV
jgi:hypothetical protein